MLVADTPKVILISLINLGEYVNNDVFVYFNAKKPIAFKIYFRFYSVEVSFVEM